MGGMKLDSARSPGPLAAVPINDFHDLYSGLAMSFAVNSSPAGKRFTHRERWLIAAATAYFASRFGPGEFQSAGLCFVASKIIRVIVESEGIPAESLTVSFHADYNGQVLELGARRPRLTRQRRGSEVHSTWSGHEIVYFPKHGAVYDPTSLQLNFKYNNLPTFVHPVVAELPTQPKPGLTIPAEIRPFELTGTYCVERPNYDYIQIPGWHDVGTIAEQGVSVVIEAMKRQDPGAFPSETDTQF